MLHPVEDLAVLGPEVEEGPIILVLAETAQPQGAAGTLPVVEGGEGDEGTHPRMKTCAAAAAAEEAEEGI